MNILFKLSVLCLLMVLVGQAQQRVPSDFIPENYKEFETIYGDLNKDGLEDCVLIIKKVDTTQIVVNQYDKKVDRNRRGIIVLFKNKNGYQLADQNLDCFSSENEDGGVYFPPDLWINIKDHKLHVHYGHGRYGYWDYTFRFQNANFELIGYDSSSNRGPVTLRETSINFLTKKKLVKVNINEDSEDGDENFEETWSDIEIDHLIQLSQIKDFDALEMFQF
ncbi:hypothetical protein [Nonlabens ulvanivorans]|uniref:Uncharacterized protein n=1 Tax=Nonlabens ulvanivorans TaxID=906888 RepID=A0A084JW20_NONUL|nr:hypothetical protein [Nonlabens ulvanivorans]KEZ93154.1 hypothetical protein IL45_13610 [Nonlabens ulvanivorans]PRX13726.1 hypothetical protein LY02_01974 [Nonlabens ulvanivorans]